MTVEYLRVFCAVRFSWPETVTDQQSCRLLFNLWKLSKEKS